MIKRGAVVLDLKFYNNATLSDAAGLRLLKRLAREYRLENFLQVLMRRDEDSADASTKKTEGRLLNVFKREKLIE